MDLLFVEGWHNDFLILLFLFGLFLFGVGFLIYSSPFIFILSTKRHHFVNFLFSIHSICLWRYCDDY